MTFSPVGLRCAPPCPLAIKTASRRAAPHLPQLGERGHHRLSYSGDSNLLTGGAATMKLNIGRVVAGVFVAYDHSARSMASLSK